MRLFNVLLVLGISAHTGLMAQTAKVNGRVHVNDTDEMLTSVMIPSQGIAVLTEVDGTFNFEVVPGEHTVLFRSIGYKTERRQLIAHDGGVYKMDVTLQADPLLIDQVVVTATRNEVTSQNAPVLVSTLSARQFETVQALSLSEGLHFTPGLRVENNCQNCGFTQIRMNGLDGAYSQILINSRPIFSALAGVYGLEMLPTNMIDRVEVVRGGGSVLHGGNAIAGTINIITKDPESNSFAVMGNQAFTNFDTPDRTLSFNGSLVHPSGQYGVSVYGYNRNREPWDATGDGFSEITKLNNSTFGFDAFLRPTKRSRLQLTAYTIDEFRRGGNHFDLLPHQSDLTEQLQHDIHGASLSFETTSKNYRHRFSAYTSLQTVDRESYYGSGGRVIEEGDVFAEDDLIALNAYGASDDYTLVSGIQHSWELSSRLGLTTGSEIRSNEVTDRMPGYQRSIDQKVSAIGAYSQLSFQATKRLTLLAGGRFDDVSIDNRSSMAGLDTRQQIQLNVPVPRLSALYRVNEKLAFRASYAEGYRAPQAFDEDLHIETVGGDVRFIRLADDLKTETSRSYTASVNYERNRGTSQLNLIAEGFTTQLTNPFILSDQEAFDGGVAVITKRNGSGAAVQGVNLEANVAISRKLILTSGFTFQSAKFNESEVIWEPEPGDIDFSETSTSRLLRTPNHYGYATASYEWLKGLKISCSAVYTGSMLVAHVIDPENEYTVLKETPEFLELNARMAYRFKTKGNTQPEVFLGVHNIFNGFQSDFDRGPLRDAGYVYGPIRPRTIFFGFRVEVQ